VHLFPASVKTKFDLFLCATRGQLSEKSYFFCFAVFRGIRVKYKRFLGLRSNYASDRENVNKHKFFLSFTCLELLLLSALILYSRSTVSVLNRDEVPAKRELVKYLKLTDLSLWTEARYTRHLSQADFFTPFQDFPSSLEHFPAGSIIGPAASVRANERKALTATIKSGGHNEAP